VTVQRVICLGDVMVDVLARLGGPLQVGSDTAAQVSWLGGGSAANTACWVAAAGVPVSFVGRVGDDAPGRELRAGLAAAGVHPHLGVSADRPTGTCLVIVHPDGERTMIPSAGANASLSAADVDAVEFGPSTHLHVSGYAVFRARDAAQYALERARNGGASISIGAASAAPLRAVGAEVVYGAAGRDAVLFANRDETAVLLDGAVADLPDAARRIAARTGTAVVTEAATAAWSDGTHSVLVTAEPVAVVDSTGAGDAFVAGFLAASFTGAAPAEALAAGHRLAAEACRTVGARPVSAGR
jgi:sugar/nucleoside kinase (ribokinase family)